MRSPTRPGRAAARWLAALIPLGAAAAQAQSVAATANGTAGDFLGWAVASAGDIDRDGFADVAVGAPFDWEGSVRVLSGATQGLLVEIRGVFPYDAFGCAVASAGDVNGDGWPDLVVGAYLDDAAGNDAGSARVVSGFDFSTIRTHYGAVAGAQLGWSVAGSGDVNVDGFADVVVGAPYDSRVVNGQVLVTGSATVYSGLDGSVLHKWYGDGHDDHFGNAVDAAGDVDGDGFVDLIVGAPWDDNSYPKAGMARVLSTNPGLANPVLYTFDGDGQGYELGWSVCGAGDVDGDGHDDLLVGQPEDKVFGDDSGSAVLYSGFDGTRLGVWYGDNAYDYFGYSVDAADVDQDGVPDVLIGEPRHDVQPYDDRGAVHAWSGTALQASALFTRYGTVAGGRFGYSVAGVDDFDGDGFVDFACGAPWAAVSGAQAGQATVHCGAPAQGSTAAVGVGCPAGQELTLGYSGALRLGQPLAVDVAGGPAGTTAAWVVFGFSAAAPFPFDLGLLGLTGCTQYQSADLIAGAVMTNGQAAVQLVVPAGFAPCGLRLYNQAIAFDPGSPLGVRISNGGAAVIAP